jgi:hypothetical protein
MAGGGFPLQVDLGSAGLTKLVHITQIPQPLLGRLAGHVARLTGLHALVSIPPPVLGRLASDILAASTVAVSFRASGLG